MKSKLFSLIASGLFIPLSVVVQIGIMFYFQFMDSFFLFSVTANTSATPRVGIITFETASGEVITTLTVSQEGTVLNLSESEITLGQEADSFTRISVTSDTEWTWTDDASWITSTEGSPQNGAFFFNNIIISIK